MIDKMMNNHILLRSREYSNASKIDHLAASRTQHLQSRANRVNSVSDDEGDAISDWSDSDREYDILSDFESTKSYLENDPKKNYNNAPFHQQNQSTQNYPQFSRLIETPITFTNDSSTSTQVSFVLEPERPKTRYIKNQSSGAIYARNKQIQAPLLPARQIQLKQTSPCRSVNRPTTNTQIQSRFGLPRENTSNNSFNYRMRTDSSLSNYSSFQTNDENIIRRQTISPNFSQTSVSRTYDLKKIFVDDYGRLTDTSNTRPSQPRNRQKWGTIVHPPFPLGYQQIPPEQVTQAVERLASPVRCRDRHTPLPPPTKRYLSVEETDALINRLTKVKAIRAPEQYWPVQRQTSSIKTLNNNWKVAGIPA